MQDSHSPTPLQRRIGVLVLSMAGAIAIAPIAMALAVRNTGSSVRTTVLLIASVTWCVSLLTYRGLALAHEHWRRRTLRSEVTNARRARLDASATFEDKLNDQNAILDRIADISEGLLEDGIIDPQLALNHVRLINSHAREAQALVEDALTEVRVEVGASAVNTETFDARDEIEDVALPFIRGGVKIVTSGARRIAETDPAMFRLMVRGLINGAVERQVEEIDISISRDNDTIVCVVSDSGADNSEFGLESVSPVTSSLAHTAGAELRFTRALGRNQYSLTVPAAETPASVEHRTVPMDVLGERHAPDQPGADTGPPKVVLDRKDSIVFPQPRRAGDETVAARRERQLTAR
ncbi:MAG: HAMP domain-containing histidine kinase [bacterium]|nr:HAMP domain-containing histidine kinase [bacterium]MCP4968187.1 HAMP domain-containing histidine kinase [bacterium]